MLERLSPLADHMWSWLVVVLFLCLALLEAFRPARVPSGGVGLRWFTNLGLHLSNAGLMTVLAPAVIAELAIRASGLDWHPMAKAADAIGQGFVLVVGILLLDLYAYGMHRFQHRWFLLWRFHAVHHADVEMDVSTTFRHHPLEALVSTSLGAVIFAIVGLPEWVFPFYALLGIGNSLLQHSNSGSAGRFDHAMQSVFVTPGMHQIHHSADPGDYNANYGTVFSFWDRAFGTYRRHPARGRAAMTFGVVPFTAPGYAKPYWGLLLPFVIRRAPSQTAAEAVTTDIRSSQLS